MQTTLGARDVTVEVTLLGQLGAKVADRDVSADVRTVETYVDELLAGLSIHGTTTVEVQSDPRRCDPLRPLRVTIDGQRCVQPVAVDGGMGRPSLPEQVRQIVCHNRQLLVTPRFSRDCRRVWAADGELAFADSPNDFLHELLTRLVRRGFSINRARSWLQWHDPSEPATAHMAFEEAAAFGEQLPLRLLVPAARGQQVADGVRALLAARWGIDARVTPVHEDLPVGIAYRLRVNDVVLPAVRRSSLPGGEPLEAAIVRSVEPHLGCLITISSTGAVLVAAAQRYPLLEQEVARQLDRRTLTAVLRGLADERVPLGDVRGALEALATVNLHLTARSERDRIVLPAPTATVCRVSDGAAPTAAELGQTVRVALGRRIADRYAPHRRLPAMLVDPWLEDRLASGSLDGHERRRLERAVRDAIAASGEMPVVLVAARSRSAVREVLAPAFPELAVLAYQELPRDREVDVVARLELPEPSATEADVQRRLAAADAAIDEELAQDLPSGDADPDDMLLALMALTRHVRRLGVRADELESADDDETREHLTTELDLLDAELDAATPTQGDALQDLTDMVSDHLGDARRDD